MDSFVERLGTLAAIHLIFDMRDGAQPSTPYIIFDMRGSGRAFGPGGINGGTGSAGCCGRNE
jgi:hypothetical protein